MQQGDGSQKAPMAELWVNPDLRPASNALAHAGIGLADVEDAQARLARFAPLLVRLFPEVGGAEGLIESQLIPVSTRHAEELLGIHDTHIRQAWGRLLVKADHDLPVAGSIKARGGIYEVLAYTERLALQHGLIQAGGDYATLADAPARRVFEQHTVSVGSTGNLGMSIGIMAAALGFKATVHMSAEARQWKKDKLRSHGVEVIEHAGDYAAAVQTGRAAAASDARAHFVDDERSLTLFLGYSVAALRLRDQLQAQGMAVDARHPLFVYLPCGVGGAPAGIAFGLKQVFGDAVHCWFLEPTAAACFLTRMRHPDRPGISVYDVGMDNVTEADGLAVPVASELAYAQMRHLIAGVATTADATLFADLAALHDTLGLQVEPSAASALSGPRMLLSDPAGAAYLRAQVPSDDLARSTHIVWSTGGRFVPAQEFQGFLARGRAAGPARA
ncbi:MULTISPECIES: D-serine ammonia-lyase [unclassified Achromobacter]|uniref:D-serine ammonia-lyase n=1 Tax=unclassified Achromobacter TaxID=2626865 RepID=UPI000B51C493|nr:MULTISPECIES: D-serine ammonia-lyase [unclassified Achromobacter]OWT68245.1 D-serine ammonia-lyase [Achromobacter sp. HZ34]OWT70082.1 D-serine ammonia-lyase [Achromobacter sp. HZ28]